MKTRVETELERWSTCNHRTLIAELVAALRAVEWGEPCICPSCYQAKPGTNFGKHEGHTTENYPPDGVYPCQLATALAQAEEK
ncbi:hypothetical protein LCGC14_1720820 [marine sediment metagenome]|uniref:Uncharacterized protein n=1 Tax=marine sediment metagenome TaxID=412755 RepID=A0A0F9HC89_9ZZZZ